MRLLFIHTSQSPNNVYNHAAVNVYNFFVINVRSENSLVSSHHQEYSMKSSIVLVLQATPFAERKGLVMLQLTSCR